MNGGRNQNTSKSGPSSAQQQNAGGAIITQYWMLACSFWFSRGSGPVLLKSPKDLRFSREGVRTLCHPLSGSAVLNLSWMRRHNWKFVDWDVKNKIKKKKNHNNEPCTLYSLHTFLAVLIATVKWNTTRILKQFTFLVCCQFILKSISIHVSLSVFSLHISIGGQNNPYNKYP